MESPLQSIHQAIPDAEQQVQRRFDRRKLFNVIVAGFSVLALVSGYTYTLYKNESDAAFTITSKRYPLLGSGTGTACLTASMTQAANGITGLPAPLVYTISYKADPALVPASCFTVWSISTSTTSSNASYSTSQSSLDTTSTKSGSFTVTASPINTTSQYSSPFTVTLTSPKGTMVFRTTYNYQSCSLNKVTFSHPVDKTVIPPVVKYYVADLSKNQDPVQVGLYQTYSTTNPEDCAERADTWKTETKVENTTLLSPPLIGAIALTRSSFANSFKYGVLAVPKTTPNGLYKIQTTLTNQRIGIGAVGSPTSAWLSVKSSATPCLKVELKPAANPGGVTNDYNYVLEYGSNPIANPKCPDATWDVSSYNPLSLSWSTFANGTFTSTYTSQRIIPTNGLESRAVVIPLPPCGISGQSTIPFGFEFSNSGGGFDSVKTEVHIPANPCKPSVSPSPTYSPPPTTPSPTTSPSPSPSPSPSTPSSSPTISI
jgi:hypothetical protein